MSPTASVGPQLCESCPNLEIAARSSLARRLPLGAAMELCAELINVSAKLVSDSSRLLVGVKLRLAAEPSRRPSRVLAVRWSASCYSAERSWLAPPFQSP